MKCFYSICRRSVGQTSHLLPYFLLHEYGSNRRPDKAGIGYDTADTCI